MLLICFLSKEQLKGEIVLIHLIVKKFDVIIFPIGIKKKEFN